VPAFTGKEINKPVFNGTVLTSDYLDLLKPHASNMSRESNSVYEATAAAGPDSPYVKQAKDILSRAEKMYKDKKYYAATSLYFNANIYLRNAQWDEGYKRAADKEGYLAGLVNKVEAQIRASEKDLNNFKSYGTSDLEAVGAAESRITAARARLDEAKKLKDPDKKISSLAFAHERARTAQWWLTLSTPSRKIIPENILKDRAGWYLSQAKSINTYMFELVVGSGGHPDFISGASEDIDHAEKELQHGYYAGAIFDSLKATVKSSTTIGFFGKVNTSGKIEQSRDAAKAAINDARLTGIDPTLAVSAYEYAETQTGAYEQIYQYTYAKMIAKTSMVLDSYAVSSNKTPIKPVLTPFISETQQPAPEISATEQKPEPEVPAFEAIAALAVILIVWRLYRN